MEDNIVNADGTRSTVLNISYLLDETERAEVGKNKYIYGGDSGEIK